MSRGCIGQRSVLRSEFSHGSWMESAREIFSRTSLARGNCKRGTPERSAALLGLAKECSGRKSSEKRAQRRLSLDSPSPGSNGCVSTAVRMKNGQRVRGTRITLNRDQHAAACGERIEDARVVRLETDASHRTGQSEFREVSALALEYANERSTRDRAAD